MKWKYWLLTIVTALFILSNLYLIFKKDSEISRLNYIENWTKVEGMTLVDSKKGTGKITPVEEQHIYHQAKSGEFKQFLVKEGEEVEVGAALLEYSPSEIERDLTKLQSEKSTLEQELSALTVNISQLQTLQQSMSQKATSDKEKGNKVQNELLSDSILAEIYEKERQKSKVEGKIAEYEQIITAATEGLTTLTVNSNLGGTIKEVNPTLNNPIITIYSDEQQIEGLMSEEEVQELSVGMKVIATSEHLSKSFEGTISQIFTVPVEESNEKKSQYRYIIQLEEIPEEKLPYGSHVELKIIKREAIDALSIPFKSLRKGNEIYVFALDKDGSINKRLVKTGIQVNNNLEVMGEIEAGDIIVSNPKGVKNESPYFTPLKTKHWSKEAIQKLGKRALLKSMAKGFLIK
ncbi:efflux RND transporter periplasmic adaptor subunit [Bacillus sp. 31A1R]|uniref:Efflux RND transporter periplasmic adaptor subunit n=1 Tax=Robertmurraya mangrovi TaxID=3098077 RepID=A0ABU5IXH9_9BACI|nr:efflux RND transporter periplasmic adaptor subunit [Bacillus sp. 31A1R]MDZ5471860.1 efflux RND transporter periplasmic adaptor subunit [Bacillus sp. 31A1R]